MSPTTEEEATLAQREPALTTAQLDASREEIVESIPWGD